MSSVLFIGAINLGKLPTGGEEYKNQLLLKKLQVEFQYISFIDTYKWKTDLIVNAKLFFKLFFCNWNVLIISASTHSVYKLIKIINIFRPKILKKIVYFVIGGYLPKGIAECELDWKVYINLRKIIVEGELLKWELLRNSGLQNIDVVPNFKDFPRSINIENKSIRNKFKFVYVGRISEHKGIREIEIALQRLQKQGYYCEVDFFGPLECELRKENSGINYCGFLDFQNKPNESYHTLSKYNCLLFPTYWRGEGFPGVIIDAYIAGLPVIASDWNLNRELVVEGINGYLIPPKDVDCLMEKMRWVMLNEDHLTSIRTNNRLKAIQFHIDTVWPDVIKHVVF